MQLSDFALVRKVSRPSNELTTEVVSLWYRPPEILLGKRKYNESVDIWSVGCIFAELLRGIPMFCGLSQVDQLFQIFEKLGIPTEKDWPEFNKLPHSNSSMFPHWTSVSSIALKVPVQNGYL